VLVVPAPSARSQRHARRVRLGGAGELALRVLCVIASYANAQSGKAFPSVATIAAHCRVSERRVKTALKTLKATGVVTSTVRVRQSNLYQLAQRVPESITPYDTARAALRVLESGHLGCRPHDTVTDQEQTTMDTGGMGSAGHREEGASRARRA